MSGLLLDTHAAVWWASGSPELSTTAHGAIIDPTSDVWFSSVSIWELAIKVRAGRLSLDVEHLADGLRRGGVNALGIGVDDGLAAGSLDWAHRDPFDRMIVAQAQRLGLEVLTRDAAILRFLGPELTLEA